jgi:flagellar assembly protein FliH
MEAIIRSAELGAERRRLARPPSQSRPAEVAAADVTAAAVTATVISRADIERLEREHAQQIAAIRREVEAERVRLHAAMADEQAEAMRAAAEAGFAQGVERGLAEGRFRLDAVADRLEALAAGLQACRSEVIEAAEETMVEIAFAAVCRIAGTQAASRAAVLHAVREAAAHLNTGDSLCVFVHPDDLASLQEAAPGFEQVAFAASPAVRAGGCLIEGPVGTLDARLDIQLAQLAAALGKAHATRRAGEPE